MNPWNDDVLRGFDWFNRFIEFVKRERAQLYGTIIYLMISNNVTEVELPPIETFISYGEDYYIKYDKSDDGIVKAKLMLKEDNGDQN